MGAGRRIGDGISGMRAGLRIGPPRRPADAANGAVARTAEESASSSPRPCRRGPRGSWSAWAAAPAPTAAADWSTSWAVLRQARERLAGVELVAAAGRRVPAAGAVGRPRRYSDRRRAPIPTPWRRSNGGSPTGPASWTRCRAAGQRASGRGGSRRHRGGAARAGRPCESGASIIAEHTGLADDIAAADLVITGEGRFDDQSLHGKVVGALAEAAQSQQVPIVVMAGQVDLDDAGVAIGGHSGRLRDRRLRRFGAAGPGRRRQPADGPGLSTWRRDSGIAAQQGTFEEVGFFRKPHDPPTQERFGLAGT